MNKQMTKGLFRHFLTLVAGSVLTCGTRSFSDSMNNLMVNISSGGISAILSTAIIVFSLLWSMWVKATDLTKQNIKQNTIKVLTLGRK